MLNMLVALLLAVAGLGGAWWNHRRLQRDREYLDFGQTASRTLFTLGSATVGIFLAYIVAFPPDGTPIFGEGKTLKNDAENGKMGRYRGEKEKD